MPLNFKARYVQKTQLLLIRFFQLTESQINLAWVHTYGQHFISNID